MTVMTVKELIDRLSEQEPTRIVVLSADGEGNSYSPIADDFGAGLYVANSTWSGEIMGEDLEGYDEDDEPPGNGTPALVLYPTN